MIWLSQILRILELQHSITTQLTDVIKTTVLVLPSFISPLMPFLLILASFFLNYKFNSSNEIVILKQYFSIKRNIFLFIFLFLSIFIFNFLNNEYFSTKLYHKYKIQELEIRNNLKLGVPSLNEFHIEEEVSIFFNFQKDNKFFDIEAIIYKDGQFIKSKSAEIEIDKKNYNLIFNSGERIILNENEKSKTIFDKFIYSIENKEIEILMMDKEHFNTLELLKKEDKNFTIKDIINLSVFSVVIKLLSHKIFFLYLTKKNILKFYTLMFMSVLILEVINSYLIFILNNNLNFKLTYYYLINFLMLLLFFIFTYRLNENN